MLLTHNSFNSSRGDTSYCAADKKKSPPFEPWLASRGTPFYNFLGLKPDKLSKDILETLLLKYETLLLPQSVEIARKRCWVKVTSQTSCDASNPKVAQIRNSHDPQSLLTTSLKVTILLPYTKMFQLRGSTPDPKQKQRHVIFEKIHEIITQQKTPDSRLGVYPRTSTELSLAQELLRHLIFPEAYTEKENPTEQ